MSKTRSVFFFINEDFRSSSTALWIYSFDSNSLTPLGNWIDRECFCALAVDSYIYLLGGNLSSSSKRSQNAQDSTARKINGKISPLNEARRTVFGVCKSEKIFIAGDVNSGKLRTCVVYNKPTDEWQFIASLTLGRSWGSMGVLNSGLQTAEPVEPVFFSQKSNKIKNINK